MISTRIGQQIHFPKMILLQVGTLILLGIWAAGFFYSHRPRLRRSPLDLPVAIFILMAAVATVFSLDVPLSFFGKYRNAEGLLLLMTYAAVYFLVVQVHWSEDRVYKMFAAILGGGVLVSAYGFAQHWGWDFIQWNTVPFTLRRSFGTFGNPSLLGGYLTVVLSIGVGLYLRSRKLWAQIVTGLMVGLVWTTLLFTYTRGAWLGGGISLLVLAFLPLWRLRRQIGVESQGVAKALRAEWSSHLKSAIAMAAIILLVFGFFLYEPYLKARQDGGASAAALSAETRLSVKNDSSIEDRVEIWKSSLAMIADRPVVGQGPDTFQLRYGQYQTLRSAQVEKAGAHAEDAHDYFLDVAATMGLPGLAGFLAIVFSLIGFSFSRRSWYPRGAEKKFSERGGDRGSRETAASAHAAHLRDRIIAYTALSSAAAAYLIDVSFTINVVGGAFLFWLVASMIAANRASDRNMSAYWVKQPGIAVPGMIVVSLIIAAGLYHNINSVIADYKYAKAGNLWGQAVQMQSEAGLQEAAKMYYEAIDANPRMDRYMSELSQRYVQLAGGSGSLGLWQEAKKANERGIESRPLEPWFYINGAIIDSRLAFNEPELLARAEAKYKKAIKLYPNSARAHHFYGLFLSENKRWDEALPEYKKALLADPTYTDVTFALGLWHARVAEELSKKSPKEAKKHRTEARLIFEKTVTGDPAYEQAKQELAKLKS